MAKPRSVNFGNTSTMKPASLTQYYLSGTGNTLKAVSWIADEFQGHSIPTNTLSIDRKSGTIHKEYSREGGLVGICFPTHGFSLPWAMLKFILTVPNASKNERFFILNSRGGTRIYSIFIPGISGLAQVLPMIIMLLKGYKLSALLPLDPPSNWISIHPGMAEWVYAPIIDRCKRQMNTFALRLIEGKRYFHPYVFIFLPIDLLLIPISIAYMVIGRFFLAKTFFATSSCNGCNLCVERCPVRGIKMISGRPYWTFSCENCMRCINICPQKAIQTPHLFAVSLIWLVLALPFIGLMDKYVMGMLPNINHSIEWLISLVIASAISLPLFFAVYYAFHYLMQFKWLNNLFKYTSLTYYWKRYLAPGVTAKSFNR